MVKRNRKIEQAKPRSLFWVRRHLRNAYAAWCFAEKHPILFGFYAEDFPSYTIRISTPRGWENLRLSLGERGPDGSILVTIARTGMYASFLVPPIPEWVHRPVHALTERHLLWTLAKFGELATQKRPRASLR